MDALISLIAGLGAGVWVGYKVGSRRRKPPLPPKHWHSYTPWEQERKSNWRDGKVVSYDSIQVRRCQTCGWRQWESLPDQL